MFLEDIFLYICKKNRPPSLSQHCGPIFLCKNLTAMVNKLKSTLPEDAFTTGQTVFENTNTFSIILNYLLLKQGVALHFGNLNPLNLTILCAKFGRNWLSGSKKVNNLRTDGHQTKSLLCWKPGEIKKNYNSIEYL